MTSGEFFSALGRRWYVFITLLIGVASAAILLWPGQHVYSAKASVTFLWPGSNSVSKGDDGGLAALVNFAGMVRLAVDDGQGAASASFGGSLVGAGVRRGFTVMLPNSGGQWSTEYDQPRLVVEAVAATPDAAEKQAASLVREITNAAFNLQARLSIPSASLISTVVSSVDVADGGATSDTRARGEVTVIATGLALSAAGSVAVDRMLKLRFGTRSRYSP